MLVASHVGWFREQERHDDLVSLGLFLGSLLVAVPLTVVVVGHRVNQLGSDGVEFDPFPVLTETGMRRAGWLLLSTGFMFRLRFTTIVGVIAMVLYLLTLPL